MTLTLEQYCEKYNYEIVKEYTTHGDEKWNHKRAIVQHKETGEKFTLYYDSSRRRKHKKETNDPLGHYWYDGCFVERGWRNTTLDNRRTAERRNKRYEEASVTETNTETTT